MMMPAIRFYLYKQCVKGIDVTPLTPGIVGILYDKGNTESCYSESLCKQHSWREGVPTPFFFTNVKDDTRNNGDPMATDTD